MSLTTEDFPIPLNPVSRRLESVDILRGLLMLLMTIDHARDYFSVTSNTFDPTDPLRSWPALFATRWITHICAPGFIALAGMSVFLQRRRGKSSSQMAKLLFTRGLWLVFLEVTVISFAWSFNLAPVLQVIWAIGICMIFLATLQRLSPAVIGTIGAVIVLLHNLLDPIPDTRFGSASIFWDLLHQEALMTIHGQPIGAVAYPVVPWIGVICLGYAFGQVALFEPSRRRRFSALLGSAFLAVFTLLRLLHGYGDHIAFRRLDTPARTSMSFLQVEKYPPSLQFLLATLGVVLLLYCFFDFAVTRDWIRSLRSIVETYGRVPFFFYVLHLFLLHAAALILTAALHQDWHHWLQPGAVFASHLDGWGFSLNGVYIAWFFAVAILYLPCRWFSRLKSDRRDWWLSYL